MWFNTLPYDPEAPKIDFKDGILTLSGNCIPTDGKATLSVIFDEIEQYLNQGLDLTLIFKFDHVNTSSSHKFIDLFFNINQVRKLDCEKKSKRKITIVWCSPRIDEDMEELGQYYKEYSDGQAAKNNFKKIDFKLKIYRYEN